MAKRWEAAKETIEAKLERVRDSARVEAEKEIRRLLAELRACFPRHSFQVIDGMGVTFVEVTPRVFNEYSLEDAAMHLHEGERRLKLRAYLVDLIDEIHAVYIFLEDECRASLGSVC